MILIYSWLFAGTLYWALVARREGRPRRLALPLVTPLLFAFEEPPADYWEVSGGTHVGVYPVSCGGDHYVGGLGAELAHTRPMTDLPDDERTLTTGLRVTGGLDSTNQFFSTSNLQTYGTMTPFARVEDRSYGWAAGLHVGRVVFDGDPLDWPILPLFSFRLGQREHLFLESRGADQTYGPFPMMIGAIALGHDPPRKRLGFRVGLAAYGPFLSTRVRLGERAALRTMMNVGEGAGAGALELRYRLP